VRTEKARTQRTLVGYLKMPRDPTVNSVLLEDSAALIGLAIAAVGVALHQMSGSAVWDGLASIAIGCLLLVVAFVLARACKTLLIGQQADPRLLAAIEGFLEEHNEVDDVVDMLSMLTGTDSVLLCLRVDFAEELNSSDLETACLRLDAELRERFEPLSEVFIQPASRRDADLRQRVQQRYGHALADE
jgi:divalent metal cation (Fe/Co/Zn/Cd) transporter